LLETYKEEAIRSLRDVENANLKGLLRRVIGKIFNDTEIKGWCKEFEAQNAVSEAAPYRDKLSLSGQGVEGNDLEMATARAPAARPKRTPRLLD